MKDEWYECDRYPSGKGWWRRRRRKKRTIVCHLMNKDQNLIRFANNTIRATRRGLFSAHDNWTHETNRGHYERSRLGRAVTSLSNVTVCTEAVQHARKRRTLSSLTSRPRVEWYYHTRCLKKLYVDDLISKYSKRLEKLFIDF